MLLEAEAGFCSPYVLTFSSLTRCVVHTSSAASIENVALGRHINTSLQTSWCPGRSTAKESATIRSRANARDLRFGTWLSRIAVWSYQGLDVVIVSGHRGADEDCARCNEFIAMLVNDRASIIAEFPCLLNMNRHRV